VAEADDDEAGDTSVVPELTPTAPLEIFNEFVAPS
jgi:hypothetical protein